MKVIYSFICILLFVSDTSGMERAYTGSTPANTAVRTFIGIPLSDSVDFIRWKLILSDNRYELQCNYGIGKPNTNGFINGGKKVAFKGEYRKEANTYRFTNNARTLKAVELNTSLLHLLNENKTLMVGNGGWSYTLNNMTPPASAKLSLTPSSGALKDSMVFDGRTPCDIPGVIVPGATCYKLKWSVVLYADTRKKEPMSYRIRGTAWRIERVRKGTWKIVTTQNGRITYQLNDDTGNGFLYLLKLDEDVLVFTDAQGKLLVGNEDFSYTLNRR
jgi:hypothetical protein